jgi:hypothetical protein
VRFCLAPLWKKQKKKIGGRVNSNRNTGAATGQDSPGIFRQGRRRRGAQEKSAAPGG